MPEMKVGAIFEQIRELLELERVPGTKGLDRVVDGSDISSPGCESTVNCDHGDAGLEECK
jgi:hypothetical protein